MEIILKESETDPEMVEMIHYDYGSPQLMAVVHQDCFLGRGDTNLAQKIRGLREGEELVCDFSLDLRSK